MEQTRILLEDFGVEPKQAVVDLGYRGVDAENLGVPIIHRGKYQSLTRQQRRWIKRRQAVEPVIGHLKHDCRMERCWLRGATGDAVHAVLCAAGYNLRWLLRAIVRCRLKPLFLRLRAGRCQVARSAAIPPPRYNAVAGLWRSLCGPHAQRGVTAFALAG